MMTCVILNLKTIVLSTNSCKVFLQIEEKNLQWLHVMGRTKVNYYLQPQRLSQAPKDGTFRLVFLRFQWNGPYNIDITVKKPFTGSCLSAYLVRSLPWENRKMGFVFMHCI